MSAIGPKRTFQNSQSMSLSGVKRTSCRHAAMSANDPKRKMLFQSATRARQLRSTTCSNLLLNIQERPRNTTSITKPMPEEVSLMSFSETWPKA
jgi:hypothetical protein